MIKILKADEINPENILKRTAAQAENISDIVRNIIENVKANGDAAILGYCAEFDGGAPESLEVSAAEIDEALESVEPRFIEILNKAAENIRAFHSRQIRQSFISDSGSGMVTGQKIIPIEKVGLYVPGGTAAYPSTVLMNAIPAKLAGCREIVITTPAKCGKINPVILAAAHIAGVTRIFKTGGAQAIAALAFGTETIPRADKIVGPGNAFVAEAKRQVYGTVAIDMIAGPSEILVVADKNTNPAYAAADLLSQAEHDKLASAVMITDSEALAKKVSEEIERQLEKLPRRDIACASIDSNGKIIIAESITMAIETANQIAPEHLELCVDNPFDYFDMIKNAGSVFLGRWCPEALGDYMAGPNHTLPTSGTARFSSPLSVDDFVKKTQFTYYTRDALESVCNDIAYFAELEGLSAHARSALSRFADSEREGRS